MEASRPNNSESSEGNATELTAATAAAVDNKTPDVPKFWVEKYKKEAARNWDIFYKRNKDNFFKDRHWTRREFQELDELFQHPDDEKTLLEVGCGVGNFIFPLISQLPKPHVYACDFSPRAVELVKSNPLYDPARCSAFVCDLTKDRLVDNVPAESVDIVSMIFVLSAIPPEKMPFVIDNVSEILKPGGVVLLRDYGVNDHAQLRFGKGHCLGENFYVRSDGTMSYYFSPDLLSSLFSEKHFEALENDFFESRTTNHAEKLDVKRIFVQARFRRKPACAIADSSNGTAVSATGAECPAAN